MKRINVKRTTAPWFHFKAGAILVGIVENVCRRSRRTHLFYDDGIYYQIRLQRPCEVAHRPRAADRNDFVPQYFQAEPGDLVNLQNGLKTEELLEKGSPFKIRLKVLDKMVCPHGRKMIWNIELMILDRPAAQPREIVVSKRKIVDAKLR